MMSEYQLYIPSADGYQAFLDRLKKEKPTGLKREEKFLNDFLNKPGNIDGETVKNRIEKLNNYYSTRLSKPTQSEIAEFILQSDFDERLDRDDYGLVDELRYAHNKIKKDGKKYDYFSFASKYCHHCRPDKYPIYDSVNVRVFNVLFGYTDNRKYGEYVACFKKFCSILGYNELKHNEGFYIDKHIQAIGGNHELL